MKAEVISGKKFSGASAALKLSGVSNRTYRGCTFENFKGNMLHGNAGSNVIFENCIFKNLQGEKDGKPWLLFYVGTSKGTSNTNYGLVFRNNQFINCTASDLFELKCTGTKILDNKFTGCKGGVRIRHGVGTVVEGNTGLKDITVRCGAHEIHDNKDAFVVLWAGNLPGENGLWQPLHIAGGGFNLQAAFRGNFSGNKGILVGKPSGGQGQAKNYPALECNVHPDHSGLKMDVQKGTTRRKCKRTTKPNVVPK